jgi:hypothetical protein
MPSRKSRGRKKKRPRLPQHTSVLSLKFTSLILVGNMGRKSAAGAAYGRKSAPQARQMVVTAPQARQMVVRAPRRRGRWS